MAEDQLRAKCFTYEKILRSFIGKCNSPTCRAVSKASAARYCKDCFKIVNVLNTSYVDPHQSNTRLIDASIMLLEAVEDHDLPEPVLDFACDNMEVVLSEHGYANTNATKDASVALFKKHNVKTV